MGLYLYLLISHYLFGPSPNPIFVPPPRQYVSNSVWLLAGDSITEQMGYLDANIINIGKSRLKSADGVARIQKWIKTYPEAKAVTLNFGTNDIVYTNCDIQGYYINIIYLINVVHSFNKIAILPTIPTPQTKCLNEINTLIKYIHFRYQSTKGLDVYRIFAEHPEYITSDNIHPTHIGYTFLRKSWIKYVREYNPKN